MILGIDHIGLATDDPAGTAPFLAALGLGAGDRGIADDYGVACEFWRYSDGIGQPSIETVSPVRPDSPIADRLAKQGPGLYHVAFCVDDLEGEFARLREHGFVPVDAAPCAGARPGMRVMFMYARRPAGLLIELVQYS
ncbi:VOC family protein [Microbispora sp. NPDC046973]|uniref:VOC family protein n=1 Tax=Microbispora sp. NPDC046973 TaxID=3155022 RepID=UPI0033DB3C24